MPGNIKLESFVVGVQQNQGIATGYPVGLATSTVASLVGTAAAAANTGALIYVSNGAAGAPVVAFSNGTNWLRCDTLAAVSAT